MTNEKMKEHFEQALKKGIRMDGRKIDEFREVTVERGVSSTAHGSARVRAGKAEVIAGVKFEIGVPYPDTPDEGGFMVATEMLPLSHGKFESGPPSTMSIEVARVIDRTIRESKTLDTKKLCITPAEKNWTVVVDIMPVSYDGNMIDLGAIAALAALRDARFPLKEGDEVDFEKLSDEKLALDRTPIAVTVFKYGDLLLLDPTEDEERMYDARLTVATLEDGKLCAMQKGGEVPLTFDEVKRMVEMSVEAGKKLRGVL